MPRSVWPTGCGILRSAGEGTCNLSAGEQLASPSPPLYSTDALRLHSRCRDRSAGCAARSKDLTTTVEVRVENCGRLPGHRAGRAQRRRRRFRANSEWQSQQPLLGQPRRIWNRAGALPRFEGGGSIPPEPPHAGKAPRSRGRPGGHHAAGKLGGENDRRAQPATRG